MAQRTRNYAGIDYFRMPAALLVAAIHTAPFSDWNKSLDFLITYCLGRIAVPFFLMITGFFVLAPYVASGFQKKKRFYRYLIKSTLLYLTATLLFLPVGWYAKNLPDSFGGFLKSLFFDGTFYHLWYFPAVIIGCVLLALLMMKSKKAAVIYVVTAYILGLAGDSYYGLIEQIPPLQAIYDVIFSISSYTRNGIFFAPLFLYLGIEAAHQKQPFSLKVLKTGFVLSLILMSVEGFLTYTFNLQRHNSMYFFLPFVMYFFFRLLMTIPGKAGGWQKKGSLMLYIIHPAIIILVRGFAKITGLSPFLVEQSFFHYLTVCLVSVILIALILFISERRKTYVPKRKSLD